MKKNVYPCMLCLFVLLTACGNKENSEKDMIETKAVQSGEDILYAGDELGVSQDEADSSKNAPEKAKIEEQSFTVNLKQSGEIEFISYMPDINQNPCADATFVIKYGGETFLTLPFVEENNIRLNRVFHNVEAVAFRDYNGDGYDDIIIICSYILGAGPAAGERSEEIRFYKGMPEYTFQYEAGMSEQATSALADITIDTALDFIGYTKTDEQSLKTNGQMDYSGTYTDKQGTSDIYSELSLDLQSDGTYTFSMGLYRITTLEGIAAYENGKLHFADHSFNVEGMIEINGEKAEVSITKSSFESIKTGDIYDFSDGKT